MSEEAIIKHLVKIEKEYCPAYLDITREELASIINRLSAGGLWIVQESSKEDPDWIKITKTIQPQEESDIAVVKHDIEEKYREIKSYCEDFARYKEFTRIMKTHEKAPEG